MPIKTEKREMSQPFCSADSRFAFFSELDIIEKFFLEHHFWVTDARIRNSRDDDGARVTVGEVDAFGQLAATDGEETSPGSDTHFHSIERGCDLSYLVR